MLHLTAESMGQVGTQAESRVSLGSVIDGCD